MKENQRVLLVHNYYKIPGGEDTVVENEKRLLEEHGHQVFVYSRSNREMDEFSAWRKLLIPFTSLFSLRTYREVKKVICREYIDVVHVHNTLSLISPSVYYAAFACKKPVVQTVHNFRLLCPAATFLRDGKVCEDCVEKGLSCAVRHSCYRGSKVQTLVSALILKLHRLLGTYRRLYYICLTDFNREKLLQLNAYGNHVIREDRVFVKPNFVQLPKLPSVQKEEYDIYIGRLDCLKGIRVLLEAWKEFPDRELRICGSGPEEEWARAFIAEHGLEHVKLLGQCDHAQVLCLLAGARALIMPTLWYEGQPMVILESFAVGTPVIASDLGNAGAMVEDGVTGLHFTCGDAGALREAVRQMEQKKDWDTQSVYREKYAPEKNYEMLSAIYAKAQEDNRSWEVDD
jgi:glycosyltransferase involved in cell wall biosynthesis